MNISLLLSEYVVSFLIIHEWAAMVNNGSGNYWLLDGTSPLPSPMLTYLEWDLFCYSSEKYTWFIEMAVSSFLPNQINLMKAWIYRLYERCVEVI